MQKQSNNRDILDIRHDYRSYSNDKSSMGIKDDIGIYVKPLTAAKPKRTLDFSALTLQKKFREDSEYENKNK